VITRALVDVSLNYLQPLLGTTDRWDWRLNDDEKQCLAFARLQKPRAVLNDALDVVDPTSRRRIEAILAGECVNIGTINVGYAEGEKGLFPRILHLVTDVQGPSFSYSLARILDQPE
jgi:putative ATP-binding cassette transporter